MHAKDYAQAIYRASQGKDEATLDRIAVRVRELLVARGHERLLPRVVRELETLQVRYRTDEAVALRVASLDDVAKHEDAIQRDVALLGGATLPRAITHDATVVGGYEVRVHGVRMDRTYKRALVEMYDSLITR